MKPSIIKLEEHSDSRGMLRSLDLADLPFTSNRIFTINVRKLEYSRGGHAHKECWQFLLPLDSVVTAEVDSPPEKYNFDLSPGYGLLIPPLNWLKIDFTSPESSVIVFASHQFREDDYIRDKLIFHKLNLSE